MISSSFTNFRKGNNCENPNTVVIVPNEFVSGIDWVVIDEEIEINKHIQKWSFNHQILTLHDISSVCQYNQFAGIETVLDPLKLK